MRFPDIYQDSRAGYSQRLRTEIQRVFGVRLSGECLRPLLKGLRAELRQELVEPATPTGNLVNRPLAGVGQSRPPWLPQRPGRSRRAQPQPWLRYHRLFARSLPFCPCRRRSRRQAVFAITWGCCSLAPCCWG